jgi:hypothetical protein
MVATAAARAGFREQPDKLLAALSLGLEDWDMGHIKTSSQRNDRPSH